MQNSYYNGKTPAATQNSGCSGAFARSNDSFLGTVFLWRHHPPGLGSRHFWEMQPLFPHLRFIGFLNPIRLGDGTQDAARVPQGNDIGGNILCHHAFRADDAPLANGDPRKDGDVGPNPNIARQWQSALPAPSPGFAPLPQADGLPCTCRNWGR